MPVIALIVDAAWVGMMATEFIESYNDTRPFFLKASFHRPHRCD